MRCSLPDPIQVSRGESAKMALRLSKDERRINLSVEVTHLQEGVEGRNYVVAQTFVAIVGQIRRSESANGDTRGGT